jgi:hypothetical protein
VSVHVSMPDDLLAGRYRMLSPLGAGDFRTLDMPLHANLAERFLRNR